MRNHHRLTGPINRRLRNFPQLPPLTQNLLVPPIPRRVERVKKKPPRMINERPMNLPRRVQPRPPVVRVPSRPLVSKRPRPPRLIGIHKRTDLPFALAQVFPKERIRLAFQNTRIPPPVIRRRFHPRYRASGSLSSNRG